MKKNKKITWLALIGILCMTGLSAAICTVAKIAKAEDSWIAASKTTTFISSDEISGMKIGLPDGAANYNFCYYGNICVATDYSSTTVVNLLTGTAIFTGSSNVVITEIQECSFEYDYSYKPLEHAESGLLLVEDHGQYDLININTGTYYDYDLTSVSSEMVYGTVIASKDNKYGLLKRNGEWLTDLEYDESPRYLDFGFIIAGKITSSSDQGYYNIRYGLLDCQGNTILDFKYTFIHDFDGEIAVVEGDYPANISSSTGMTTGYGFINSKGELLTDCCYYQYTDVYDGSIAAERYVYGYSDYLKENGYYFSSCDIISSNGTITDLTSLYGGYVSLLSIETGEGKLPILAHTYIEGNYSGYPAVMKETVYFYGFVNMDGSIAVDMTDSDRYMDPATESYYYYYDIASNFVSKYQNGWCLCYLPKVDSVSGTYGYFESFGYLDAGGQLLFSITPPEDFSTYSNFDLQQSLNEPNVNGYLFIKTNNCIVNKKGDVVISFDEEVNRVYSDIIDESRIILYSEDSERYGIFDTITKQFGGFIYTALHYAENSSTYLTAADELGNPLIVLPDQTTIYNNTLLCLNADGSFCTQDDAGIINFYNQDGINITERTLYPVYAVKYGSTILVTDEYGQYGMVDSFGNQLLDTLYSEITPIGDNLYDYYYVSDYASQIYGVVNSSGEFVIDFAVPALQLTYSNSRTFTFTVENADLSCTTYIYRIAASVNSLRIYDIKTSLEVNEEIWLSARESQNEAMQYSDAVTWTSSDETVLQIMENSDSTVEAKVKGVSPGLATITVTLANGETASVEIRVVLSAENMLTYFPEYLTSNSVWRVMNDAEQTYVTILNQYSSKDDVIASFFTGLKSGSKILLREIGSTLLPGMIDTNYETYVKQSALLFLNQVCQNESLITDIISEKSEDWSSFKSYYKVLQTGTSNNKDLAALRDALAKQTGLTSAQINEIEAGFLDNTKLYTDVTDTGFNAAEAITEALFIKTAQINIVDKLIEIIPYDCDLKTGLLLIRDDMKKNIVQDVLERYATKEGIDQLSDAAKKYLFTLAGADSFSIALGKLSVTMIVNEYKNSGGVMADELIQALFTANFASVLKNNIYEMQVKCVKKEATAEDYENFRFVFKAYVTAVELALTSSESVIKPEFSFMEKEAEQYLHLISQLCTYDNYMYQCVQEAMNNYPRQYQITENNGKITITGTYQEIGTGNVTLPKDTAAIAAGSFITTGSFNTTSSFITTGSFNTLDILNTLALNVSSAVDSDFYIPVTLSGILIIPSEINGQPVTSILSGAFSGRTDIKGIVLPDSITEIGAGAFMNCTNLEYVLFGDNQSIITEGSFVGCTSLNFVQLPAALTTIEADAFNGCTALTYLVMPSADIIVKDNALPSMISLTTADGTIIIPDASSYSQDSSENDTSYQDSTSDDYTSDDYNSDDYTSSGSLLSDRTKKLSQAVLLFEILTGLSVLLAIVLNKLHQK